MKVTPESWFILDLVKCHELILAASSVCAFHMNYMKIFEWIIMIENYKGQLITKNDYDLYCEQNTQIYLVW